MTLSSLLAAIHVLFRCFHDNYGLVVDVVVVVFQIYLSLKMASGYRFIVAVFNSPIHVNHL